MGSIGRGGAGFIRPQLASTLYRRDGTVHRTRRLAVWTLVHRGYSGSGRLDVWVYRTRRAALFAGADLAMQAGLDEDPSARELFAAGRYAAVLARYEQTHPDGFLLRVQAAFLQHDADADDDSDVGDGEVDDGTFDNVGDAPPPGVPGYLDADEELVDRFTLVAPDQRLPRGEETSTS